jgi:hypothetical protein
MIGELNNHTGIDYEKLCMQLTKELDFRIQLGKVFNQTAVDEFMFKPIPEHYNNTPLEMIYKYETPEVLESILYRLGSGEQT